MSTHTSDQILQQQQQQQQQQLCNLKFTDEEKQFFEERVKRGVEELQKKKKNKGHGNQLCRSKDRDELAEILIKAMTKDAHMFKSIESLTVVIDEFFKDHQIHQRSVASYSSLFYKMLLDYPQMRDAFNEFKTIKMANNRLSAKKCFDCPQCGRRAIFSPDSETIQQTLDLLCDLDQTVVQFTKNWPSITERLNNIRREFLSPLENHKVSTIITDSDNNAPSFDALKKTKSLPSKNVGFEILKKRTFNEVLEEEEKPIAEEEAEVNEEEDVMKINNQQLGHLLIQSYNK
jgi:hypothetical protein